MVPQHHLSRQSQHLSLDKSFHVSPRAFDIEPLEEVRAGQDHGFGGGAVDNGPGSGFTNLRSLVLRAALDSDSHRRRFSQLQTCGCRVHFRRLAANDGVPLCASPPRKHFPEDFSQRFSARRFFRFLFGLGRDSLSLLLFGQTPGSRVHDSPQHSFVRQTHKSLSFLPVHQQNQRWHSLHTILPRNLRLFGNVHLANGKTIVFHAFQNGQHLLAGLAVAGREIQQLDRRYGFVSERHCRKQDQQQQQRFHRRLPCQSFRLQLLQGPI